jgi:hypothetical protein
MRTISSCLLHLSLLLFAAVDSLAAPPKMCDRSALCAAIVQDNDIRRLSCSFVKTCVAPAYFDCLAEPAFSLIYGCGGLDCVEVQPFATSLEECILWFPRVRNSATVRLVAERRSSSAEAAKKAAAADRKK